MKQTWNKKKHTVHILVYRFQTADIILKYSTAPTAILVSMASLWFPGWPQANALTPYGIKPKISATFQNIQVKCIDVTLERALEGWMGRRAGWAEGPWVHSMTIFYLFPSVYRFGSRTVAPNTVSRRSSFRRPCRHRELLPTRPLFQQRPPPTATTPA